MSETPNTPKLSEVAERMWHLFRGNDRSVGRFNPANGKVMTLDRAPVVEDFVAHIRGKEGVGVVPICDDGLCHWAAIDIDNHGEEGDLPLIPLAQKSTALGLPLVMCRSKSGGIHAYIFFSTPVPAPKVRTMLALWAEQLGHKGCEIFPKQSKLHRQANGNLSLGDWINLPYMGGKETIRYAVHHSEKIGLLDFLDLAESKRTNERGLAAPIINQYDSAPPCIQKILHNMVGEGQRNEALFNTDGVFAPRIPGQFWGPCC